MATLQKVILTRAGVAEVWDAVRDVGALHTRLVVGFVVDTVLDGKVRSVTFGNGMVVREPIVSCDDENRRLVWTAEGGRTTHYNASLEAFDAGDEGTRLLWRVDLLPDSMAPAIDAAMTAGAAAMKRTLDRSLG